MIKKSVHDLVAELSSAMWRRPGIDPSFSIARHYRDPRGYRPRTAEELACWEELTIRTDTRSWWPSSMSDAGYPGESLRAVPRFPHPRGRDRATDGKDRRREDGRRLCRGEVFRRIRRPLSPEDGTRMASDATKRGDRPPAPARRRPPPDGPGPKGGDRRHPQVRLGSSRSARP